MLAKINTCGWYIAVIADQGDFVKTDFVLVVGPWRIALFTHFSGRGGAESRTNALALTAPRKDRSLSA
jgi:hypothetical protein